MVDEKFILSSNASSGRGFTLIELMIVVAIVAILAAVAAPSYLNQISTGYRTDAQGALTGFAQAMERHYTVNGTYLGADGSSPGAVITDSDPKAPTIYTNRSPSDGNAVYNLLISQATATTYTLIAEPISGSRMDGDGTLALTHTGARRWDRNDDGDYADADEDCWQKSC